MCFGTAPARHGKLGHARVWRAQVSRNPRLRRPVRWAFGLAALLVVGLLMALVLTRSDVPPRPSTSGDAPKPILPTPARARATGHDYYVDCALGSDANAG